MGRPVPLDDLRSQHEAWMSKLNRAAEGFVTARAGGLDTDHYARQMREAERKTRSLERRIKRRKT